MARYVPNVCLMMLCILVWILWQQNVYPFTDPVFAHDGYALHFFGGIGYTAFQVTVTQLSVAKHVFSERFFVVQVIGAILLLGVLELMQLADATRHVQIGDLSVQTFGVVFTVVLLYLLARKRVRKLPA